MQSPLRDLTPEKHAEAIRHVGSTIRSEHTRLLQRLDQLVRDCNPLQMLAHFAFYDRAMFEIQQGGSYKPLPQHGVEFFHGYFLTIPVAELNVHLTPPEVILELNEVLRGLNQTFPMLGLDNLVSANNERKKTLSLAQSIRIQTHAVRNAGYYQQVMKQLKEVFGGLDDRYFASAGVKLSSLVAMCENIVAVLTRRLNRRIDAFRGTRRCKTARDVVLAYCDGLALGSENRTRLLEACTSSDVGVDEARAMCNHDADLRAVIATAPRWEAIFGR